ncbi:MAG: 4Fe-4S dicluster domain-containing protein [Deltaproteobacteria bacterium]|nr:4Fe-4S dicluster domain-containing protein [Deltaproteobacteria bacterium]
MEVAREIYWNIGLASKILMYAALLATLVVFGVGLGARIRYWRRAKPEGDRFTDWARRVGLLLGDVLLQRRVVRKAFPGIFHGFIFYAFVVCTITTAVVFIDADFTGPLFDIHIFRGWVYLLLSVGADVGGALAVVGLGLAAWRRYVGRAEHLERKFDDAFVLVLLALILITGFLLEGLRIHHTGEVKPLWSPVGYAVSLIFSGVPRVASGERSVGHLLLWWVHLGLALTFIASLPYTKLFHILSLPTNVFLQNLDPNPALERVDLEALMSEETFDPSTFTVGMASERDFPFTVRIQQDACIECGRCQDVCPSTRAGDPFGPMTLVQRLRDYGHRTSSEGASPEGEDPVRPIIPEILDEHFAWYCRTCRACMEVCPAKIEHIPQIMEIRRNEVSIQGRLPEEAQVPLRLLQSNQNAFGNQEERVGWIERCDVRVVGPGEEVDVLYFVGCLTSFDLEKRRIAEDLFRVLKAAGVDFGVLGGDELCCGDPARVLGDEMVFQTVAKAQIEALRARRFRILLVSCPHCLHTLGNEYRRLGAAFEVVHHSRFLSELVTSGRLRLQGEALKEVAFHDPCYLGRYQGAYEDPRRLLSALPGVQLRELAERREQSLCCGGGGGHFWMDFKAPQRINNLRMEQVKASGAGVVATGCPYCLHMLVDSVKLLDLEDRVQVQDLATLAARALPADPDDTPTTEA